MEKKDLKKIEYYFFAYPRLLSKTVQSTVEWAELQAIDYTKPKVKSSRSTKREEMLCRLIDQGEQSYRWLTLVDKVKDRYKYTDKYALIDFYYLRGLSKRKASAEIGVSERTFRRWKNEILETAYLWAQDLKLI